MKTNTEKLNAYGQPMLTCPRCSSNKVVVREEALFMANSGEHYCHSVKAHDSHAAAACLDCDWDGYRSDLKQ